MSKKNKSAFAATGLKASVTALLEEIRDIYRSDQIPWVVGYSGGKDSSAVLQLVWFALAGMPEKELTKPVHVISTDTLVENPVVASWVSGSLEMINAAAKKQQLPITAHRLTPEVEDTYWVNLIGKGYAAPRHKFRWCTFRLKIMPSNTFITKVVRENGEAILVLGTRKAESSKRAHNMKKYEQKRIRARLSPNASLPNSLVFSPIEEWANDDVWLFLMQHKNPWGIDNKHLLTMYKGASPDGECPLVVDTTTPSCGSSRFGCWVCTLVDEDKSMKAMIQNDEEKEWMLPLLELRDELGNKNDRALRDFRRMHGNVQLFHGRTIHGPYKQSAREAWLTKVLEAQTWLRENGPEYVKDLELVTLPALDEIRRIWVVEKHEIEDSLPGIYEKATGHVFPGNAIDDSLPFGEDEINILRDICNEDHLHFEMLRDLIDIERRYRTMARRAGLYDALNSAIEKSFYEDEEDATQVALENAEFKDLAKSVTDGAFDMTAEELLQELFSTGETSRYES